MYVFVSCLFAFIFAFPINDTLLERGDFGEYAGEKIIEKYWFFAKLWLFSCLKSVKICDVTIFIDACTGAGMVGIKFFFVFFDTSSDVLWLCAGASSFEQYYRFYGRRVDSAPPPSYPSAPRSSIPIGLISWKCRCVIGQKFILSISMIGT